MVVVLALGLNATVATYALGVLGRLYRGLLWLIVGGLAIWLALWAVRSMSVQVAVLVGALIIAGAIWLTRR